MIENGVGPPLASSTPGRPQPTSISPGNPTAALNSYDSFNQTRTMEMSSPLSPVHQYQPQDRLQTRIGITPGYEAPSNGSGVPLLSRMHDTDQPTLAERLASTRGRPSSSRTQLASRLAATGDNPPSSLAHRLANGRESYPTYQGRAESMNHLARGTEIRGGGLMARMVGGKRTGKFAFGSVNTGLNSVIRIV
jgi:hypothetical protein